MNTLIFEYNQSCRVSKKKISQVSQELLPEIKNCSSMISARYNSPYASLALATDKGMIQSVQLLIEEKRKLEPTMLIIIGIGGSNLGIQAVQEALLGKLYNPGAFLKIYFADTVDSDAINDIALLVEQGLKKKQVVLLNVISKSGTTIETIANFEIFFGILKKYYGDAVHNYIIVTTDKDSALWKLAQQKKYACLEIPKNVGGRYSVFSSVGLFPLGMLSIDIEQLIAGARESLMMSLHEDIFSNPAALSAAILAYHYRNGIKIHDSFIFSVDLEGIGKWYRQLMGESIGKSSLIEGESLEIGMTPTVSIGSTDLHSVGQLYLGGPHDKYTTFIRVAENKSNCVVSSGENSVDPFIQNKSFATLMNAIISGTQAAYRARNNPFSMLVIPQKTAFFIGQFLQLKMCEIMYLAFLLKVNPFDQPNVEAYKNETRKILADE